MPVVIDENGKRIGFVSYEEAEYMRKVNKNPSYAKLFRSPSERRKRYAKLKQEKRHVRLDYKSQAFIEGDL